MRGNPEDAGLDAARGRAEVELRWAGGCDSSALRRQCPTLRVLQRIRTEKLVHFMIARIENLFSARAKTRHPNLRSRVDERQAALGIVPLTKMRRAFGHNHFEGGPDTRLEQMSRKCGS